MFQEPGTQPDKGRKLIMKSLNKNATIVFILLMERMNGQQHIKIVNTPYMPLTVEKIGGHVVTPWGIAQQYSLCHYFKQDGDLFQDPEMCFFVTDNRVDRLDFEVLHIVPYMYQQATLGIYEESVQMEDQRLTTFYRKLQKDHTAFANQWLHNIKQQGFLLK